MSYNTIDDFRGEISDDVILQLCDDSNSGLTVDMIVLALNNGNLSSLTSAQVTAAGIAAGNITKAITRGDGEVDGYCGKRYQVPFDPLPDFVKSLALDLAIYTLFSRRENVPENRKMRRDNAVKNLEGLAKGIITLGLQDPQPNETFTSATPEIVSGGRIFKRDTMRGY